MNSRLISRNFGDVTALKLSPNSFIAYHAKNMEVAKLTPEAWEAFENPELIDARQQLIEWNSFESPTVRSGKTESRVKSVTINVTQVCNLHCQYCAAGGDGSYGDPVKRIDVEKTLPQIKFFLSTLKAGETFRITFLGGEPLLYPKGIELIVDYVNQLAFQNNFKPRYTIVTNGTLFNKENIKILIKGKFEITVSIDGPAETNDRLRPSKGGRPTTEKVIVGLKLLLGYKDQLGTIGLSGVFGKANLDLKSAYEFYKSFDVDWYDFTFDHHAADRETNISYIEALLDIAGSAVLTGGEKALRKIQLFDHYFDLLDHQQRIENFCGAGKSFFVVDSRNQIYTCPWQVGKKDEMVGVGERFFQDKLSEYQDSLIEIHNCHSCWARFVCGGGCMFIHQSKTGDKHTKDPEFCERTRTLFAHTLIYYEKLRNQKETTEVL